MSRGWRNVRLGEVSTPVARAQVPISGTGYRQIGVKLWGEGAYERPPIDGSQTKYGQLFRAEAGDIIVNKIWARNGSVAVVPESLAGCFGSGEFPMFAPDVTRLDPRWMHWLAKTPAFWEQCGQKSRGTSGKNRIRPDQFMSIEIPLPSLAEQGRVVARIDEVAARIDDARDLRNQAIKEAAALYLAQLSIAMRRHGEGWKRETIADVIESMDAGWSPQCEDLPAREGEWGVLKTTSVQWSEFRREQNKALPSALAPNPNLAVRAGDVLVTRAGPRKRVGVVAAVQHDEPCLMISDKLIRLRTNPTKMDAQFVALSIASPFSQEYLVQRKTGLADAQVNISQAILNAAPIAPLSEQRRIVAYLSEVRGKVDSLTRMQADSASELDALLPAILDRAFKGQLV